MLRGDIVKDDSGHHAVFTGQGASASRVIAATVLDVISRSPCTGQSSDAVSAWHCTQVEVEVAPELHLSEECLMIWTRLPKAGGTQTWHSMDDPVVPLEHFGACTCLTSVSVVFNCVSNPTPHHHLVFTTRIVTCVDTGTQDLR